MRNFKITHLNTLSVVMRKRKQWLSNLMLRERLDTVCLQETKLASLELMNVARELSRLFYHVFTSSAVGRSGGIDVLVGKTRKVYKLLRLWKRCSVALLYNREMHKVVSIHAPNAQSERKSFFIDLRQYETRYAGGNNFRGWFELCVRICGLRSHSTGWHKQNGAA